MRKEEFVDLCHTSTCQPFSIPAPRGRPRHNLHYSELLAISLNLVWSSTASSELSRGACSLTRLHFAIYNEHFPPGSHENGRHCSVMLGPVRPGALGLFRFRISPEPRQFFGFMANGSPTSQNLAVGVSTPASSLSACPCTCLLEACHFLAVRILLHLPIRSHSAGFGHP